ncbi:MAG TPA: enoyl-CoA hydratase-related protein [Candidatus Limnocylindria bacterium]|nr:enoyl-CoA hydratase-related protein [Candidatus Limnocylindria bacterium]
MTVPLRVDRDGAVAVLTLDRPDVLNAFDEPLTDALTSAIHAVALDAGVRCVVITGAGRAFSAGQDLRDRAAGLDHASELRLGDELRRRYHPVITAIREMRKPVIAAVHGIAAGAGLGLAVACDVRVASSSATFHAAWSRVGLVPDAGAAFFLPRLIGWGRAIDMALSGGAIPSDEALRIGLVTRVWPDAEFGDRWHAYAKDLAAGATEAYALTKEALNAAGGRDLGPFLDAEAALQDRAGRSHDYAEGVRAFLEKRPARFSGS